MPSLKNRIGDKYGRLTVVERAENIGRRVAWRCLCECGNECIVLGDSLQTGNTKSCGCLNTETRSQLGKSNKIDLAGQVFGKLTVLEDTGKRLKKGQKGSSIIYKCRCECGNIVNVESGNLRTGNTMSCGCLGKSQGEYLIEQVLIKEKVRYENNKSLDSQLYAYNKQHPLRFDFIIYRADGTLSCVIEYDGEQHFHQMRGSWGNIETFNEIRERDLIKNRYCFENNIPIIRIPYTVKQIQITDLIPSMSRFVITKENEGKYYESLS